MIFNMMYPFFALDDGTEIVHSEMSPDGKVKVYMEKPDEKDCFRPGVDKAVSLLSFFH